MLECKRISNKIFLENYTKRCLANLDKKRILQQYIYSSKTSSNWAQLPRHRSYSRFQHGLAINQNREKGGNRKKDNRNRGSLEMSFHLRPTGELNFVGVLLWFFFLCIHPILQAHGDPSPLFTSPEEYESRKWNHVHQCASPAVTAHGRRRERKGRMSEAGAWQCEGYRYSLGQIQQYHWRNHREKSIATKSEASEKMQSKLWKAKNKLWSVVLVFFLDSKTLPIVEEHQGGTNSA